MRTLTHFSTIQVEGGCNLTIRSSFGFKSMRLFSSYLAHSYRTKLVGQNHTFISFSNLVQLSLIFSFRFYMILEITYNYNHFVSIPNLPDLQSRSSFLFFFLPFISSRAAYLMFQGSNQTNLVSVSSLIGM